MRSFLIDVDNPRMVAFGVHRFNRTSVVDGRTQATISVD